MKCPICSTEFSPWISVKDRLPTKGQVVDIWARFANRDARVCEVTFTSKGRGFDSGAFPLPTVIAWMPIPESPKP